MSEVADQTLEVLRLTPSAELPFRAYPGSAALDLFADLIVDGRSRIKTVSPGTSLTVGTGIALRPPPLHCVLVCSRSGLATKGIFVVNAPGIVDPDYTGEIKVILTNVGLLPQYFRHGDRIAQALVTPFSSVSLREVTSFPPSIRGEKGFGSSGL